MEVIVTLRPWDEPEPFECVICQRAVRADRWRPLLHKAPLCFTCSNSLGQQVRIRGITRGDHHVLQRLKAVADELSFEAKRRERRGRGFAF